MTLAPGATVGRYQILAPLGQGGMATVYKAFQPSLQRDVALKVLRPGYAQDKEFLERFEREAIAIARLRHPHIVQVFDFEVSEGQYVLAMEFLEGGTLKEHLTQLAEQRRGLDPKETVRIVWEVADALSYAHELGIVHRDIKPSNVMLTRRDRAVVTDFGIARILGATSHTQTGVGIGTPEYMAPEQGQGGAIDHRADIYSLGAMAYEMLTGRVPYLADTPLAVVLAHMKDPLPLPSVVNPTIGKAVERALLRALAKDREQRFPSAIAFAEALRNGLAEDSRGGTVPTIVVRGAAGSVVAASVTPRGAAPSISISLPAPLARRPIVFGVAGALLVGVVGGGLVASSALRSTPEATPALTIGPVVAAPTSAAAAAPLSTLTTATLTALPSGLVGTAAGTTPAPPPASPVAFAAVPQVAATAAAATPTSPAAFPPAPTPAPTPAPPPTPAPTPPPTPAPTPTSAPKFAIPAKGALLYEAKLDGTAGSDFRPGVPTANGGQVKYLPGAFEMTPGYGGQARADFNVVARAAYVAEIDISVSRGSDFTITWHLRSSRTSERGVEQLAAFAATEVANLDYHATATTQPTEAITPDFVLAGLQAGRTVTIAIVVGLARFTVYVDQKQVAQGNSARISTPTQSTLFVQDGAGSLRLTGARFYELPNP